MARWASLVEARRKERPVLLVDAGDFYVGADVRHGAVIERYLFQAMRLLGYDAAGAGEFEARAGLERLAERAKKSRFTMVGSNIIDRETKRHPLPREIVRDLGGVTTVSGEPGIARVGITSVILPSYVYRIGPDEPRRYVVTDPRLAALESVTRLRALGCHVVIVLSHLGWEKSRELARDVPGIDIVVNAHQAPRGVTSERIGPTVIVNTGRKEYDFPEAVIVFESGPLGISVKNRCPDALSSGGDERLLDLQSRYAAEIKALDAPRRPSRGKGGP